MEESKPVQEMMTRFIIITNKLKSLGKVLTSEELVSKVLRILPASWESKVTAIQEAKELDKISLDELVGNLKTHEMRKIELRKKEPKRDKALVLKGSEEDESDSNDPNLAKVAKFMKNSKNASKRENNGKHKQIDKATYDGSYKYSKLYHRAFVAAYEDNRSDKEESKEDEAKSLYDVIDAHETVETEPPLKLGMHIGRPSLFDGHHYDEWKMRMETFLQATDFDLWVTFCNKTKEEYDDEDRQLIQKNAKAKNLLYRSLPRNILYKVSSCISTHDIWRTLEADFGDENIEVALMAIEESQTDEEVIRMMAMSDSETEDETNQVKDLKNQVLELTSKNEKSSDTHCKGKMSDLQDNLEKELKRAKDNLCDVGSRNKILQKTSRKRVGHFRDTCPALIHAQFKNTFVLAKEEELNSKPLVQTNWTKVVSTSKSLEHLHMDLCGPLRVRSMGDKRCMVIPILEKTPYELLRGIKPNITHLRAFGYKCFVHNNGKEALGKFDDKSDEGIFLGYSPHSKAYKVFNKRNICVEENVHVIFDESNNLVEKGLHDEEYDIGLTGE
ncbi:uncharacterized protein [Nicotiana tomentosiformis]|uniref:uncharacterized protein n=1 Tax=Nicotiana tomentosiformis TaxID=4098 RepID=UPI00388CD704